MELDAVIDLRRANLEQGEAPNPDRPDGLYPVTVRERALQVYALTPVHRAVAAVLGIEEGTWTDVRQRNPGFDAELASAREKSRVAYLNIIDRAANADWRAAREMLRFGWPHEYAPRGLFDALAEPVGEPTAGSSDVLVFAARVRNDPKAIDAYHDLLRLAPRASGDPAGDPGSAAPAGKGAVPDVVAPADRPRRPKAVGESKPRRPRDRRHGGNGGAVAPVRPPPAP